MKDKLTLFAHDLDSFCSKLNHGLIAVVVLLTVLVLGMIMVRAEQSMADMLAAMPAGSSFPMGF